MTQGGGQTWFMEFETKDKELITCECILHLPNAYRTIVEVVRVVRKERELEYNPIVVKSSK